MLRPYLYNNRTEAGCDEAGRGCLAGPVTAAAVILPKKYRNPDLNDSKKLSPVKRAELREEIIASAVAWSVAFVDNNEIDELNILRASIKAMHLAIDGLSKKPTFLLVDGNSFFPYRNIKHQAIIKGDATFQSIAAASILAKTFRDEYMEKLHSDFPAYGWNRNKGYPTPGHKNAIKLYGITPFHRRSFQLTDSQLAIDFNPF
jgi:ribonuclease HII